MKNFNEVFVYPNVIKKLQNKRINLDKLTPEDVIDIAYSALYNKKSKVLGTKYPHIQAILKNKDNIANLAFVGESSADKVISLKSVYKKDSDAVRKALGGEGFPPSSSASKELVTSRQTPKIPGLQGLSANQNITQTQKLSNKAREALKKELLVSVNNPNRPIELFKESVIKYAREVLDLKDRGKLLNMVHHI